MATLKKQVWINQILKNFYPESNFLQFAQNFDALVENDKITFASSGVDPAVLINNTTYPIAVVERVDTAHEMVLDLFETENTLIREPEAIELAYDKVDSVTYGHKMSLLASTTSKAAHAFTPMGDTANTPVIETTGEDDGTGRKRMTVADVLRLKRRYDTALFPKDDRFLVLDPLHLEDLILFDTKAFKNITDFVNGTPQRFAGFNMLEFANNAKFNPETMQKVPFGSVTPGSVSSSFSFQKNEVMKADGNYKMYAQEHDPRERATIIGFDKRFIALPIRNKGIGAIVSAPVA